MSFKIHNNYLIAASKGVAFVFLLAAFTGMAGGNVAFADANNSYAVNDNNIVACPECFDFKSAGNNLYYSKTTSQKQIKKINRYNANAIAKVREYYPDFEQTAMIYVCTNKKCDSDTGFHKSKDHKAFAIGSSVVIISSNGIRQEVFTHEFAHIALHKLMVEQKRDKASIPIWFDEGLSVFIAKDKRYLIDGKIGLQACKYPDIANLPITEADWDKESSKSKELYGKSGCAVSIWAQDAANDKKMIYNKIVNRLGTGNLAIAD